MAGVLDTHGHNAHNVTSSMLSGLKGRYKPKWSNIYTAMTAYTHGMISERNKSMDNTNKSVHGETDDWLLSDEPWQIQGHAMLRHCWTIDTGLTIDEYWILYICYLVEKHLLISIVFVFVFVMCYPSKAMIKNFNG